MHRLLKFFAFTGVSYFVLVSASGQNSDLVTKLAAAKVPAVGQPLVIDGSDLCGAKGDSNDTKTKQLDNNKNRTDEPNDYISVDWDDMVNLPANAVNKIQGAPISVIGYLSHRVKVQTEPPGESTNCHLLESNEVDWHIYLTKQTNQPIKDAVIVETTPRVRPNHKWTTQQLTRYVNKNQQVRISGWLMYDYPHLGVVGTQRATVWEVHPITKIEVQNAQGQWVNIEQ
jgi:hypothetical protein